MTALPTTSREKIIPTVWRERILKRDFCVVLGKMLQPQQAASEDTDEPYLRSANVQWDGVNISDVKTMWFSPAEKRDLLLQSGDLLVNEGGDVGRCSVWNGELPVCYYQNAINRVRPRNRQSTQFLYYWLFNIKHAGYIDAIVSKTTIAHLTAEKLERLPMPDVHPEEQERIAAYLDASCAALDAAVAAKRRQFETLDALRKEAIQRVMTRGLDENPVLRKTGNHWMEEVPAGWGLVCLKRVADIQTGLTLGKVYDGPLIERPYLRVANVQDGHLALDDVTIIEIPAEVAKRVELRVDDVLMTEGGDLDKLARGFLWNGEIPDCLHQNHIFAVRCLHHKLLPKFLTYLTASRYGRDYFEATGKRTTNLASTNSTKVGAFPLPLPSVKEQARMVEYLEAQLDSLSSLQNNLQTQIETLLAYRKSLIHECVTGQRLVKEADVERIKMTTHRK
jgi:type I restriction enzyme, S subunit